MAKQGTAKYKILNVLASVGTYATTIEIIALTGLYRMHVYNLLKSLEVQGYVEKVLRAGNRTQYYWCITNSGRHEHAKLEQIHGQIELADTKLIQDIESRDIDVVSVCEIMKNRDSEAKIKESFKTDARICAGKSGIEKYFLYDRSNPVDTEIVQRILINSRSYSPGHQEWLCRKILCSRLNLRSFHTCSGVDQMIEARLRQRCLKAGKTRNELVRELFCIQFNMKTAEVGNIPNPALFSTQGIAGQ